MHKRCFIGYKKRYNEILFDTLDLEYSLKNDTKFIGVKKFKFLNEDLGVFIPDLIKDFIVGPRTNIEHEFDYGTREDAIRAYELAKLFVDCTDKYTESGIVNGFSIDDKSNIINIGRGVKVSFGKNTDSQTKKRFIFTYYEDGINTGDYFILTSLHKEYLNLILELFGDKSIDTINIRRILSNI